MSGTIGISPDQVLEIATNEPAFRLGTIGRLETDDGTKEYMYVFSGEAITGRGYVVQSYGGFGTLMLDSTSAPAGIGTLCGIAPSAVPDDSYYWMQISGKSGVFTLAAFAAGGAAHCTATPGAIDDAATAGLEAIYGIYVGTTTGGGGINENCYLNRPVIGTTA